eukprot:7391774-Prymnesium_polylepis.1
MAIASATVRPSSCRTSSSESMAGRLEVLTELTSAVAARHRGACGEKRAGEVDACRMPAVLGDVRFADDQREKYKQRGVKLGSAEWRLTIGRDEGHAAAVAARHWLEELHVGQVTEGTVRVVWFEVKVDGQRAPDLAGHVCFAGRRHENGIVASPRRTQQLGRRDGIDGAAQAPREAAARGVLQAIALVRLQRKL